MTESLQLFCKTLSGRTIVLDVDSDTSIEMLKKQVEDKEGIPTSSQHLIWSAKVLYDTMNLSDYKIPNGSTIHLTLKLLGGN